MPELIDWRKIKNGNKTEFDRMFDYYYHPLCSFAYTYLKNTQIVEDVVIELFSSIWETRGALNIKSSLKNYLLTLTKNHSIDLIRKNKIHHVGIEHATGLISEEEDVLFDDVDIVNKLHDLINKLPDQRRKILKLAVYEGKSYAQIAEELDISINTVKTQMSRAYKYLKEKLNVSENRLVVMLFLM
ncbi:RNA polymerase sigma factor [Plebeiibacterium marinum]|uniref:RNA polymerase sigma-70 factor n=1 Tax=Plebeiibacterium marinum TaxID=2992111 RepID=A0AAE3MAZ2_9BACT|nr:RNA polymerase sigma-70 factor [Plebeiobacterium marinum]MCW3804491.1 RNA polymerase sigma-70 factor [Plebeiobacterium marinum]